MRLLGENVRALVVRDSGVADGVYQPERRLMQFGARVFQFVGERNFAVFKRSTQEWVLADLGRRFDLRNPMAEILSRAVSASLAPPEFGWSRQVRGDVCSQPRLLLYMGPLLGDHQHPHPQQQQQQQQHWDGGMETAAPVEDGEQHSWDERSWQNLGGVRVFRVELPVGGPRVGLGFELGPGRRVLMGEDGGGAAGRWNSGSLTVASVKLREGDVVLSAGGGLTEEGRGVLSDADLLDTTQLLPQPQPQPQPQRQREFQYLEIAREEKLLWRRRVESPKTELVVSGSGSSLLCVSWTEIPHARGYCVAASDDGGKTWWPVTGAGEISKTGKCGPVLSGSTASASAGAQQTSVYLDTSSLQAGEKKLKFSVAAVFWRHGHLFTSCFSLASAVVQPPPTTKWPHADEAPSVSAAPAGGAAAAEAAATQWWLLPSEFEEGYSLPDLVQETYEVTVALDMTMDDVGRSLGITEAAVTSSSSVEIRELDLLQSGTGGTLLGRWNAKHAATDVEVRKGDRIVQVNEERRIEKIAKMIDSYKKPLPEPAIKKLVLQRSVDKTYLEKIRISKNTGIIGDARRLLNAMTRCSARNFFLFRHCGPVRFTTCLPDWLKFDPEILEQRMALVQKLQPLVCSENTPVLRNALDVLKASTANFQTPELADIFAIAEAAYATRHKRQERAYVQSALRYIARCDWRNLGEAREVLGRAKEIGDAESVRSLERTIEKWEKEKERDLAINEFNKYLDPNRKFRIDAAVLQFANTDAKLKEYLGPERLAKAGELLKLQDAQDELNNLIKKPETPTETIEEKLLKVKNLGGSNPDAEEIIRAGWAATEVRRSVEFSLRNQPIKSAVNYRALVRKIQDAEVFHKTNFAKVVEYVGSEFNRIKSESVLRLRSAIGRIDPDDIIKCLAELSDLEVQIGEELALKADTIVFNSNKFWTINQELIKVATRLDDPKLILSSIQRAEKFRTESGLLPPQLDEAHKAYDLSMAIGKVNWALTHDSYVGVVRERVAECEKIADEYFLSRPVPEFFAKVITAARAMIEADDRRNRKLNPEEEKKAELLKRALHCRRGDYIKLEFLRIAIKETEQDLKDTDIFRVAQEELNDLKRNLLHEKL